MTIAIQLDLLASQITTKAQTKDEPTKRKTRHRLEAIARLKKIANEAVELLRPQVAKHGWDIVPPATLDGRSARFILRPLNANAVIASVAFTVDDKFDSIIEMPRSGTAALQLPLFHVEPSDLIAPIVDEFVAQAKERNLV